MLFCQIAKDVHVVFNATNNHTVAFEIAENSGDVCEHTRAEIGF